MPRIAAVIVAFDRDNLLERAIQSVKEQSQNIDLIIVVDNAGLESTQRLVESFGGMYVLGDKIFGSAGGFSLGLQTAYNLNFDWFWLLDDDGTPDTDCLHKLLTIGEGGVAQILSPLSVSVEQPHLTANIFYLGFRRVDSVHVIRKKKIRFGKVQFYNGVLLKRDVLAKIGYPKTILFMRGDEIDYYRRCKKHFRLALVTEALFFHPSSSPEYSINRRRLLSANVPSDPKKKYYQFRNRGYLISEYKLPLHLIFDVFRYSITFLVFRKLDWSGLIEWFKLMRMGLKKDLRPFT